MSSLGKRAVVLAVVAGMSLVAAPSAAQTPGRPIGDIQVFATLGYPGHPGGLAVDGRTLYVDTSNADFDRPFDGSDEIWAYNLDTATPVPRQPNPIQVARAAAVQPMGLLGLALDAQGRLYAADMNGRIDRVDPRSGAQEVYATIPTSTDTAFTDMPAFVAFGGDGNLYVGESAGPPVIWRVPPGGGQAQPWFVDPRLAGTFGASVLGLAVDPSGQDLYFAAGTQEQQTVVYRLPLAHPDAAHLEEFHRYSDFVVTPCPPDPDVALVACAVTPAFGAGGIAFGATGKLYVALFAKSQLSILDPAGTVALRFPSPEDNAERDIPVNNPFGLAFDGRGSLLMANTGDPTIGKLPGGTDAPGGLVTSKTWVVFDIFVDDTASPLIRPVIP